MGIQSDALSQLAKSAVAVDFEAFYQSELPRVYNFFWYRVGDDQIAEDLTAAAAFCLALIAAVTFSSQARGIQRLGPPDWRNYLY